MMQEKETIQNGAVIQETARSREILQIGEEMLPFAYWLYGIPGLGSRTIRHLLMQHKTPYEIYHMPKERLERLLPLSNKTAALAKRIADSREETDCTAVTERFARLKEKGIGFTCLGYQTYPRRLAQIPDPPYALYFIGRLPEQKCPSVAIIGARNCSAYGRQMAKRFGEELAMAGISVISGMARGIDGIGQSAALAAGGYSLGVLGCGADICYPAENRALYRMLCAQGGVCSEYPPGTRPKNSLFPPRNRIISGLSDAVLVIEAKGKSGTLITVDMALEQGKEVYALPGRVTEALSEGCNGLLKQGAGLVLSPQDLIREILGEISFMRPAPALLSARQADLLDCMGTFPEAADQIKERMLLKCGRTISIPDLMAELMHLSIMGHVNQIGNGYFMKA